MGLTMLDGRGHRIELLVAVALVVLAAAVAPAFAYDETGSGRACNECHGTGGEVGTAETSSGPHKGFTTGTQKCQTCHEPHGASALSSLFLVETSSTAMPGVSDTCMVCHDGSGASGVYGVIARRDALAAPGAMHGVDLDGLEGATITPGSTYVVATNPYRGINGSLSCADCHSPHGSDVVEPFVGDRLRVSDETTRPFTASDRLLRKKPGPAAASLSTTQYGTEWCQSCHDASAGLHADGHPVATMSNAGRYYNRVELGDPPILGPLGGSNEGYVTSGSWPICQQCHEDSRSNISYTVAAPSFTPSLDGTTTGNPRFQNFPHESENATFLVEADTLCDNCH